MQINQIDNGTANGQGTTIEESTTTNFIHLHIDGDAKTIETVEIQWKNDGKVELAKKGGLYVYEDSKGLIGGDIKKILINGHEVDFVLGTEGGGTVNIWLTWDPSAYDNGNDEETIEDDQTPTGSGTGDDGTGTGTTDPGTGTTDPGAGTTDPGAGH